MGRRLKGAQARGFAFPAGIVLALVIMSGCSHFQAGSTFEEANALFVQGKYGASLSAYEGIMERYPQSADRALFEMGIIYAYPGNGQKDNRKALECFGRLIREFPGSRYRHDSERMIFHINNITMKDEMIATQQAHIEALRQEVRSRADENASLKREIESLKRKISALEMEQGTADKVLIEKKKRQLSLMSDNKILKTYRIALGGNPEGPKVMQGDNKTPEGTYIIDARNMDSRYHLSLHISYPNERDRKRARVLGVPPGGDIMIHGIKNGYSVVGDLHTRFDWTKGCIAVTDEEIEEIERLVPNGTIVEIRP